MEQTHEQLSAIYDSIIDALLVADAENRRLVRANRAACQMFGYEEHELVGNSIAMLHPPEDLEQVYRYFDAMAKGQARSAMDLRCRRKDGSEFLAEVLANRLTLGGRACLIGIFRDVTEAREAADLLRIQRDLAASLAAADDLHLACTTILKTLRRIPGVDISGVYLFDQATGGLNMVCADGVPDSALSEIGHFAPDRIFTQMVTKGKLTYARPEEFGAAAVETCQRLGVKSLAIIPIWHEQRPIAALGAGSRRQDDIPVNSRHTLETIASQLGAVIARLEAEQAIRDAEQRFFNLVEHSASGYAELDPQGRVVYVNQKALEIFGYTREEALRQTYDSIVDAADRQRASENWQQTLAGAHWEPREYKVRARDGSLREILLTAVPLSLRGRLVVQASFLDITERRRAERALGEQESRLRLLLENLPDMVLICDQNGTITYANHGGQGITKEQLLGTVGAKNLLTPEASRVALDSLSRAMSTGEIQVVEVEDVFDRWWLSRVVPLPATDDRREAMIICTDVTEQKRASQAIAKEQRLLRHLLDLHERERRMVAYEIHDGFAQQITAALYNLESFRRLKDQDSKKASDVFNTALSMLRAAVDETRRLISGLRPPALEELGLVAAIECLAAEFRQRHGVEIEFIHDLETEQLAQPLETAIFRVVQEALTNACRHSRSPKVRIELFEGVDKITVLVKDWGVGFELNNVAQERYGLRGIRERARLLGGQVTISTAPGQGTEVFVELPLILRQTESD